MKLLVVSAKQSLNIRFYFLARQLIAGPCHQKICVVQGLPQRFFGINPPAEHPLRRVGAAGIRNKPQTKRLQRKLIDLGLLSGQPDGHFGNYTATAVKEMQRRYGMEQTGIADKAFLDKLYS